MRQQKLTHQFVEYIPDVLEDGVLYVSMQYRTVTHKCCCGCGSEVNTPLSPKDWRLMFDGKSISLEPSIGSWSLPCQSHYFITNDRVRWAPKWSKQQIAAGRTYHAENAQPLVGQGRPATGAATGTESHGSKQKEVKKSRWGRMKALFWGK